MKKYSKLKDDVALRYERILKQWLLDLMVDAAASGGGPEEVVALTGACFHSINAWLVKRAPKEHRDKIRGAIVRLQFSSAKMLEEVK